MFGLTMEGFFNHLILMFVLDCMCFTEEMDSTNPSFKFFVLAGLIVLDTSLEFIIKMCLKMISEHSIVKG